jgi:hypothetical protein
MPVYFTPKKATVLGMVGRAAATTVAPSAFYCMSGDICRQQPWAMADEPARGAPLGDAGGGTRIVDASTGDTSTVVVSTVALHIAR